MAIGSEIRSQIRSLLSNGSEFGAWLRNSEPSGDSDEAHTKITFDYKKSVITYLIPGIEVPLPALC